MNPSHQRPPLPAEIHETRIQSIDFFRVIAIFAVIVIHTTPFSDSSNIGDELDLATTANQLARFAVPFFFILSRFLWGRKVGARERLKETTLAMAKRVLFLFFAWSALYLLPTDLLGSFDFGVLGPIKKIAWNLTSAVSRPFDILAQGTKKHLWYLIGLFCSLSISAVLIWYRQRILLMVIAVVLYIIGLAAGAYSMTPLGFHAEFNFRNGPFFSLIFFATGYILQQKNPSQNWLWLGLAVTIIGAFFHFSEIWILHTSWGITMAQDYVASTYLFALGVAMIALSNSTVLHYPRTAKIGPSVIGIYTAHMIFVDLLKPFDKLFGDNPIWSIAYIVSVFSLSYVFVKILLKFSFTRKLVS